MRERHCERCGALQHSFRRNIRQQRRFSRALECAGDTEHAHGDKDLVHAQPAAERSPSQEAASQPLDDLASQHDMLPRIAIRCVTGDENKNRHWQKLDEPDHAEIESAARQRIDVPAHGNDSDLS